MRRPPGMRVLGLSGSLRRASINSALLRAAVRLAPAAVTVTLFTELGALPLFNPDLDCDAPATVQALRRAVAAADALLIASPEYAHGVSGPMKNALDWLVSFEPFVGKRIAVLNASPRAHHAYQALLETLRTMSAALVPHACVALPLLGSGLNEEGMVRDPAVRATIQGVLENLRPVGAGRDAPPSFPVS